MPANFNRIRYSSCGLVHSAILLARRKPKQSPSLCSLRRQCQARNASPARFARRIRRDQEALYSVPCPRYAHARSGAGGGVHRTRTGHERTAGHARRAAKGPDLVNCGVGSTTHDSRRGMDLGPRRRFNLLLGRTRPADGALIPVVRVDLVKRLRDTLDRELHWSSHDPLFGFFAALAPDVIEETCP